MTPLDTARTTFTEATRGLDHAPSVYLPATGETSHWERVVNALMQLPAHIVDACLNTSPEILGCVAFRAYWDTRIFPAVPSWMSTAPTIQDAWTRAAVDAMQVIATDRSSTFVDRVTRDAFDIHYNKGQEKHVPFDGLSVSTQNVWRKVVASVIQAYERAKERVGG